MIPAGKLRHKVTIQSKSATKDGTGQRIDSWSTLATVRANIKPARGSEKLVGTGEIEQAGTVITIRYSSAVASVNADDRVIDARKSTEYDITSVGNVNEEDRTIELNCVRRSQ